VQIPALSSALEGMSRAETQLDKADSDIVRAPVASSGGDVVDLSASMVALMESKNSFEANTKVFQIADQMTKDLLNVIG
jgi:flagellar basal body rod protein FlgC